MQNLKIATAQFENRSRDKQYNLKAIDRPAAAAQGTQVIAFHECSVTGYTFARKLDRAQLTEIVLYRDIIGATHNPEQKVAWLS
ncbi:carbon-nitrogen hydrolase family protein [Dyadobacter aurulentus]|uniref:hypothetical protein n=1 Tax=Dyadobacter sp. UC 10 TaxID=2605428 RepID=UPI00286DFB31|nr:hypothetical protein [Dyadobacter sp. UC 10]